MIKEILLQLQQAIKDNNRKKIASCKRVLNSSGMDDITIQLLLSRIDYIK